MLMILKFKLQPPHLTFVLNFLKKKKKKKEIDKKKKKLL